MNKKIKFILKCILVILPFIVVMLYTKFSFMAFADEEAPYYIWNKNICTQKQDSQYDVVILGDSCANAAYIPELMSDKTINLSLGGTTPMENYYTMKEFLSNNEAPRAVYISFADQHLYGDECFFTRIMYNHRYSISDCYEMLMTAKEYNDAYVYKDNAIKDFIEYELYLPNKYITSLSKAKFFTRYADNKKSYDGIETHQGRYIKRCNDEWFDEEVVYENFTVSPLLDYYYKELIRLCITNDIKVHLVKLPLPNANIFSENYNNQWNEYYNNLKIEFPSITVDRWDTYNSWNFADGQHMNTHGSMKFSTEIKGKYNDEFNDEFSLNNMFALDDNVLFENKLEKQFDWITYAPFFSMIVYDGRGDFEEFYEEEHEGNKLSLIKIATAKNNKNIYVVYNIDNQCPDYNVNISDNISVDVDGKFYLQGWAPFELNGYSIAMINNEEGRMLVKRNFILVDNKFEIVNN